jgi:hypothetical protein
VRRFPPPWSVQELDACFVVTDSTRQKIAYVHIEDDPERRSAAKLLSCDEALRIAVNFAMLPDLMDMTSLAVRRLPSPIFLTQPYLHTHPAASCLGHNFFVIPRYGSLP